MNVMRMKKIVFAALFCNFIAYAFAQTPTLEQIMAEPDWLGRQPIAPYLSMDGKTVYFERKKEGSFNRELWRLALPDGQMEKLSTKAMRQRDVREFALDRSGRMAVYARDGDIFVRDLSTGVERQLTATEDDEYAPQFVDDSNTVGFWRGDSYFWLTTEGTLIEKLTLKHELPESSADNAYDPLAKQQLEFFATVRREEADRKAKKDEQKVLKSLSHPDAAYHVYLGKHMQVVARSVSPNGQHVILVLEDDRDERGRPGHLARFVTRSGYVEIETLRQKVGRVAPRPHYLVWLDVAARKKYEIDYRTLSGIHDDPLADLRKKARRWHKKNGADQQWIEENLSAPEQRPVEITDIAWSKNNVAALQIRARDNKDRWIATLDMKNVRLVQQHRLTDPAWINWAFNDFGWMPDGRTLWYLSEESGYSHLYLRDTIRRRTRQLTQGHWEVSEPKVDEKGAYIYFRANRPDPTKYDIFRVNTKSGEIEQLTHWGGDSHFLLPRDSRGLVLLHSTVLQHPELYWLDLASGASPKRLTHTVSDAFQSIDWVAAQIVKVPSSHVKRPIYARLYKPKTLAPGKRYPAVVFVHGAGYLQNSHQGWSDYFREMMFHTFLVNHGYIVLDMDYRGSEGYGRDWRTAIYRQMGHPEVEDLEDGVRYLAEHWQVDPKRVGVYGGSYGGFLTFMSLFRKPDLFAAGAALRPVADWKHYNHEYTSNILNTPQLDPWAYRASSPIEFAEGLAKPLLICSPMLDDNVFFQDSVRLVQRLIELKKTRLFNIAIYPMERHGFKHASSWLDEYTRIFELMERHVKTPQEAKAN